MSLPEETKETSTVPGLFAVLFLLLTALAVRLLPWEQVFQSGNVYLYDPDCYMRLRKIFVYLSSFPTTAVYDYYEGFPKGTGVISPPTLEYLIAAVLSPFRGAPSLPMIVERGVAVIPPLVGAATVLALYCLTRRLFGRPAALVAGFVLAFAPAHIEATVLGRFDNEMIEPLLLILTYGAYLRTCSEKDRPEQWVAAGILSALFLLVWRGALFPLALIGIDILYRVVFLPGPRSKYAGRGGFVMYATLSVTFAVLCASDLWKTGHLFSYAIISWFHVVVFSLSALFFLVMFLLPMSIRRARAALLLVLPSLVILLILLKAGVIQGLNLFGRGDAWLNSVQEYQPLFQGTESLSNILHLYGGLFAISPFLLILLRSRVFRGLDPKGFLVLWTVVMLLALISRQRFAPYYVMNMSLLAGLGFSFLSWKVTGDNRLRKGVVLSGSIMLLFLLQFPTLPYTASLPKHGAGYTFKGDMEEALLWLRDSTPSPGDPYRPQTKPSYGVLSRWDYGGWIESVAGRPAVATNYGTETYGMEAAARFFLSSDEAEALSVLRNNAVRYLLLDKLVGSLAMYAGLVGEKKSFFVEQWDPARRGLTYVPGREYYSLVYTRLFYADGSLVDVGPLRFDPVEGIRLVCETGGRADIYGFPWEIKRVKVFEVAEGATVLAKGEPGRPVTLVQLVETNRGRRFVYQNVKQAGSDGSVRFVLPYAQKAHALSVGGLGPVVLFQGQKKVELVVTGADWEARKTFIVAFPRS